MCDVDGCERRAVARGVCSAHHKRLMRHGSPTAGRKSPGDVLVVEPARVGYSAVHKRLVSARGRAAEHSCGLCGAVAREWAFVGTPEAVEAGKPYSEDLASYVPLCSSCHIRQDWKGPRGWARAK
jgi:hypothetical protein